MKTTLPESIATVDEAKAFITELYNNAELYHPEEDANEVGDFLPISGGRQIFKRLFTPEEATKLNGLFNQIDNLQGFCPCSFSLSIIFKNSHRHD